MKFFNNEISFWIIPPVFLVFWTVLCWAFLKVFFFWIRKFITKTETKLDDVFLSAINLPFIIIFIASGLGLVFKFFLPAPAIARLTPLVPNTLKVLIILAIVLFVDKLVRGLIHAYSVQYEILHVSKGIVVGFARILILFIGVLIILDSLGVSITPVLASLGIGSLAVALALQPTLENLFAGIQIILDQPIKPGQFIKLETGEEGYVDQVGWRSTRIRQLANNMVIIPNSHLINSRVLNFYYPTKDLGVIVEVGVHYSSNLEKVEHVTIEVARQILQSSAAGEKEFKPFIRYHTFASSSINFSVILRAPEFTDSYLLKHEFIKALKARYDKEGIVIPYPIMALNTEQEKAIMS